MAAEGGVAELRGSGSGWNATCGRRAGGRIDVRLLPASRAPALQRIQRVRGRIRIHAQELSLQVFVHLRDAEIP